jgi:hypothetical protein
MIDSQILTFFLTTVKNILFLLSFLVLADSCIFEGMQTIPLSAMIQTAENGLPFNITFCTADYRRKTAGEVVEIQDAILQELKRAPQKITATNNSSNSEVFDSRRPHHRLNDTRNILLPSGKIRKFHPRLVITFNGMEVIY